MNAMVRSQEVVRLEKQEERAAYVAEGYDAGFKDGLRAFAWWRDGDQLIGTCGTLLGDALRDRKNLYGYRLPSLDDRHGEFANGAKATEADSGKNES